jgi:hypothetical protein
MQKCTLLCLETLVCILIFLMSPVFAELVDDPAFAYSVNLPESWVRIQKSDTHHTFLDTSLVYPSFISIRRHSFTDTAFEDGEDWIRMNFIAYLLSVQYSEYPFGVVVYFDSSETYRKSNHWAPEAWSMFFTADSTPTFSEFIIFSEANGFGYEMYAMGDSADMIQNIGVYVSILDSIALPESSAGISFHPAVAGPASNQRDLFTNDHLYDLTGTRLTCPGLFPDVSGAGRMYFRRGKVLVKGDE